MQCTVHTQPAASRSLGVCLVQIQAILGRPTVMVLVSRHAGDVPGGGGFSALIVVVSATRRAIVEVSVSTD